MISKTRLDRKLKRKTNSRLVETIILAKKKKNWLQVANLLTRKLAVNLDKIEKESKEGDTVVIPGKVLGGGILLKKVRVAAFSYSGSAKEKLKNVKCEATPIEEEINKNPEAKGVKIIT
ncbi:50S ribosomal protein L18e [Candidatus Woesearchaeota archaeon CG10_big_fil_rev_8_21_14_0_10_34_12]|nr:MAG: 50S ribosomal protein L18e [Candidatus Woesearchaeota archaeon CG10_big_fil_rev_8_21_14_0_10_34_12]